MTATVALIPLPSVVDTVIWQEPGLTDFIVPFDAVATFELEEVHFNVLLAASVGLIVTDTFLLCPSWMLIEVGFTVSCAIGLFVVFGSFSISDSILSLLL